MAISLQELEAKWGGVEGGQNAPPETVSTNIPAGPVSTMEDLQAKWAPKLTGQNVPPSGVSASPDLSFQELQGRKDASGEMIPIDTSGLDVSTIEGDAMYWTSARHRLPEHKAMAIQNRYGLKTRVMDSGDVAIEVKDMQTGKPKEIVLNPAGMGAHDLLDLTAAVPEMGIATAVAIATRGRGLLRTAAQIILSSASGGASGAIRDVIARGQDAIPIDAGEIASTRTKEALFEAGLEGVFGAVGKATGIFSPFAKDIKPGSLTFNAQEGIKMLKEKHGIEIAQTPSQKTGSTMMQAVEEAEFKQPGARNVAAKSAEKRERQIWEIVDIATTGKLPDEQIGESAISTLTSGRIRQVEDALETARTTAETKGQKRIVDMLDEAAGIKRGGYITRTKAGDITSKHVEAKRINAKSKVDRDYQAVRDAPGGSGDVLDGTLAADAAEDIKSQLPRVTKEIEKEISGEGGKPLVDASGRTLKATATESQIKTTGVPDGLLKFIADLESFRGGRVSLDTLTTMKNSARDEIAKTEAVPKVKDRWFNLVASAYESAIEKAAGKAENIQLKEALIKAKDTYKNEYLPFDRPGLRELALDEFDAGNLSGEQVFRRIFQGDRAVENLTMLQQVLGKDSSAFKVLKRAWFDEALETASDKASGTIKPEALESFLSPIFNEKREIAEELFGKNNRQIFELLKTQKLVNKQGDIGLAELRTILNLKDPSKDDVIEIFKMQRRRNEAYGNGILRDIADGYPFEGKIKPSEFSTRLANAPIEDVRTIMNAIGESNPKLKDAIAAAELFKLLNRASVSEAKTVSRRMAGEPVNFSSKKLAKEISENRDRLEVLMGDKIKTAEALANVLAPEELAKTVFGGAGSLAQTGQLLLVAKNPLKYAKAYTTKAILAVAYLNPAFSAIASNRMLTPSRTAVLANAMIASEPFISRMVETFGPEEAQVIISDAKQSIDTFISRYANSASGKEEAELNKFMQGKPAQMKLQPTP